MSAAAPGLLILVVVPSGSVSVRLTRTVAGRRDRAAVDAGAAQLEHERVVLRRPGSTATVATPAATAAREMLTPLPPAC